MRKIPSRWRELRLAYAGAQAIKLKLTGLPVDAERVRAVRAARPDAWLGVDANQGFTRASLADLMPVLVDARVGLIEQPFPIGREADLDGLRSPIPIAADESAQDLQDVAGLVGRFDIVNIKLDKSGGLTEGLAMARQARALGLGVMVGNMTGTALGMAPAALVGQLCRIVDLDGPIFLRNDRSPGVVYENGTFWCPPEVWGGGARTAVTVEVAAGVLPERKDWFGQPRGLTILFLTEMWEMFSYYGMRALLVYYMVKQLAITQQRASLVYGMYTAFVYFTPIVGGIVCDRWLGRRNSVLLGGSIMAIGHFMMAFESLFFVALATIGIGNGLFLPSLPSQINGLYRPDDPRRTHRIQLLLPRSECRRVPGSARAAAPSASSTAGTGASLSPASA